MCWNGGSCKNTRQKKKAVRKNGEELKQSRKWTDVVEDDLSQSARQKVEEECKGARRYFVNDLVENVKLRAAAAGAQPWRRQACGAHTTRAARREARFLLLDIH